MGWLEPSIWTSWSGAEEEDRGKEGYDKDKGADDDNTGEELRGMGGRDKGVDAGKGRGALVGILVVKVVVLEVSDMGR